ncbi:hypothetical protein D9M68_752150 [compost metagenome]
MVDAIVDQAIFVGGERRQRHALAVRGHDLHPFQHVRILRVAGIELQHHAVLIHGVVQRGDLPLAKGVAEHAADGVHVHAQALRCAAVDVDHHLLRGAVALGVHVAQLGDLLHGF